MTVSEKAAYLKGLYEGMKIDSSTNEGKLFAEIIDVIGDIASEIGDIEENSLAIGDELDQLSEDLADLEDIINEDEAEEDDEEDDDDYYGDDDDPVFFSVTCPACNKEITVDEDVLNLGAIDCPNCGQRMEFEFDEDDDSENEEE